jgi:hypothetical protein
VSEGHGFVLHAYSCAEKAPRKGLSYSRFEEVEENGDDKLEFEDDILLQAVDEVKLKYCPV